MAHTFKESALLKHDLVKKAYNEMRIFPGTNDEVVRDAVKVGEAITRYAADTHSDFVINAIAASVMVGGMLAPQNGAKFKDAFNHDIASYVTRFQSIDTEKPQDKPTPAEALFILGTTIAGVDAVRTELDGNFWSYPRIKKILEAKGNVLEDMRFKTDEKAMLTVLEDKLLVANNTMQGIMKNRHESLAFELTGLPEHPLLRGVYDDIKKTELEENPFSDILQKNVAVAKIAWLGSTDPEVVAAAFLAESPRVDIDVLAEKHESPRLKELYLQTSPWKRDTVEQQPDALQDGDAHIIHKAVKVHFLDMLTARAAKQHFIANRGQDLHDAMQTPTPPELLAVMQETLKKSGYMADNTETRLTMPVEAPVMAFSRSRRS